MLQVQDGAPLTGLRVLLVEDQDDIRELLTLLLRSEGVDVQAVASARPALEAAATWEFDVLLTDLGLPDVAGEHLIREILGMKGGRLRVVAVTGFSEPYVARAREAGADAVLTKPLDWSVLRDQLTERDAVLAA